jgi:hypothetical protein
VDSFDLCLVHTFVLGGKIRRSRYIYIYIYMCVCVWELVQDNFLELIRLRSLSSLSSLCLELKFPKSSWPGWMSGPTQKFHVSEETVMVFFGLVLKSWDPKF